MYRRKGKKNFDLSSSDFSEIGEYIPKSDTLQRELDHLADNADKFIIKCPTSTLIKFHNIVKRVQESYGKQDYKDLYDKIQTSFSKVTKITPGTIGAYFKGCSYSSNGESVVNPACTAACAGSVPLPKGTPGWKLCDTLCLIYDGKNSFNILNDVDSSKEAVVYIPENIKFNGFSKDNINALKSRGIEKAKISQYSDDGMSYKYITPDFTDLDKFNTDVPNGNKNVVNTNVLIGVAVVLGIVLLISSRRTQ